MKQIAGAIIEEYESCIVRAEDSLYVLLYIKRNEMTLK